MNKDKKEPEYPAELESQFILRLPEEPAKTLREVIKSGDSLKNRLSIQIENDMRHGEVKFDQWTMHAKVVDLPTIVESLKTIDNKSFYKTADVCQMMICKEEPDQSPAEEEAPKNKKKDPFKVDKKFLWPHGVTPPTKNVRKRRFRKTLKKKCVEAPEIEKEVKRLLRADNEADSVTWEVIQEDEDQHGSTVEKPVPPAKVKPEKKTKQERNQKRERETASAAGPSKPSSSNVVDIFGGAVSDSDLEEEAAITASTVNVDNVEFVDDSRMSGYDHHISDSMLGLREMSKRDPFTLEFDPMMFEISQPSTSQASHTITRPETPTLSALKSVSSEDDGDYILRDSKENMTLQIEQARVELEELKQRRQRTQHEIAGLENLALRQRFQDILHTLNQDIMFKEMEYQGMVTLQNSDDI